MPNRLAREKSPYLRMHADNPIDWYPWGEEAFRRAREEDKPIFLSIGYYTCHWCHVMNRESFMDPEVARVINRVFIPVKVDREERPDVDSIYMKYAMAVLGSGGWPLTVLLTPDKKPFFIATYLPRQTLIELAERVERLWRTDRGQILRYAEALVSNALQSPLFNVGGVYKELDRGIVYELMRRLSHLYDPIYGGFGQPPKFPNPHRLLFLLRMYWLEEEHHLLEMVVKTIDGIRFGGIYDQVGGGLHRYSTDARWKLPHFEKMLYDQAWMMRVYTEAYQLTGDWVYRETIGEIWEFLLREMWSGEAFYSALDAESEGMEGRFYVWTSGELREVLGDHYGFAVKVFNISEDGNYLDEATGRRLGYNILYPGKRWEEKARELGMGLDEFLSMLREVRSLLLGAREERVRPNTDTKILTDWNGYMAGALAYAGRVLGEEEMVSRAESIARFIVDRLWVDGLMHVYIDGEPGVKALLDDYASLIYMFNELYMATSREEHLRMGLEAADEMVRGFYSRDLGVFMHTPLGSDDLPHPNIEVFDGPYPGGLSLAIHELMRLSRLTGEDHLWDLAVDVLKTSLPNIERSPEAAPYLVLDVVYALTGGGEVVVDARGADGGLRRVLRSYLPFHVIHFVSGEPPSTGYVRDMLLGEPPKIYVCQGYTCSEPVTSIQEFHREVYGLRRRWSP